MRPVILCSTNESFSYYLGCLDDKELKEYIESTKNKLQLLEKEQERREKES